MQIAMRKFDYATILDVTGKIDIDNSRQFRDTLLEALQLEPVVMVNFERIEYIDSSGIASLVESYKKSKELQRRFVLYHLGPMVRSVLDLTRLTTVFEIYETEEQALKAARPEN